ncbi:protein-disulfide reductase DsbD family protein [Rhodopirellula sp. P2]|uniref:protein-disulfide reductase DsbD family protein n=1 Tax=Rhodopirellula sp. P2 TaxID=2127060 RepID=UPI0023680150|nr:protein-disulfide reductase DsbD domain-containing protein [Rhodopirellula sp. P2]WDQ16930.1 protein-disulfide reductase DsbD family protein [Rhodopirellula sp. P2]
MDRSYQPGFARKMCVPGVVLFAALLAVTAVVPVHADNPDATGLFSEFSLDDFAADGSAALQTDDPADATATYSATADGEIEIQVQVKLQPKWHLYSTTQPQGGPKPTKLSLVDSDSVKLVGDWKSDREPLRSVSQDFGGITVEEFEEEVNFTATAKLLDGATVSQLGDLKIRLDALTCLTGGACMPINETLTAKFTGEVPAASSAPAKQTMASTQSEDPAGLKAHPVEIENAFRDRDYVVRWEAINLTPELEPGQTGTLRFTAIPDAGYHVYTSSVSDEQSKTNFVVSEKSKLKVGAPQTKSRSVDYELLPGVTYHDGNVTWTIPVSVPADAAPGEHKLAGGIAYQACTDDSCQQPKAIGFETVVNVVPSAPANSPPKAMTLAAKKRMLVLDDAATLQWVDKGLSPSLNASVDPGSATNAQTEDTPRIAMADAAASGSSAAGAAHGVTRETVSEAAVLDDTENAGTAFGTTLLFAFIGGVILNFMPCVLPVVGLKVMSFVQQAGQDRKRIFFLNVVYALGILSVFAVLTTLAVVLSFNWGQQFTYFPVRLGLTLLMFAMALSYLGVWEIPAPGMAGGKTSQALQQREGYTGAFFKGVFATVLATPCSGPLLGGILGLTFALTSLQTVAVIMIVGVGMALPYLMIGIWPSLVAWLPKPGTWMETLKEFLAFLFLGTVAFFFNQFSDGDKLPVFVAMIGVWFGCWIIGKVPSWSSLQSRLYAWSGGVASAIIIGVAAFQWLGPAPEPAEGVKTIAWQPYDEAKLKEYQSEGRTVMIDFTAKWCVNCIVNYNVALNTEATRQLIEELDAVPMLADWTDQDPEIEAKLKELQSRSIPVLAIYPGKSPAEPIVLRDLVSQQMVLDALENAGPSIDGAETKVARSVRSGVPATTTSLGDHGLTAGPATAGTATR